MNITITPANPGTASGGPVGTVSDSSLPGTFIVQKADGSVNLSAITNLPPTTQVCSGTKDAVLFPNALNVVIFTSTTDTGGNAATLAVPGATDAGKLLVLVNTNTTQNVITTTAGKIVNGGTPGATLTAPAAAGAVTVLVATNGFWNLLVLGTGTWVLS